MIYETNGSTFDIERIYVDIEEFNDIVNKSLNNVVHINEDRISVTTNLGGELVEFIIHAATSYIILKDNHNLKYLKRKNLLEKISLELRKQKLLKIKTFINDKNKKRG